MRVAGVQFDIAWEDKPANHETIRRLIEGSQIDPGAFVLLPELGDTGFSFDLDRIVDEASSVFAARAAQAAQIWLQAGFAERGDDGRGRNCAVIYSPEGREAGRYRKVHPFTFGKEASHYTGGDHLLLCGCAGAVVCPMICYDLRFPELFRHMVALGMEIAAVPSTFTSLAVSARDWSCISAKPRSITTMRLASEVSIKLAGLMSR